MNDFWMIPSRAVRFAATCAVFALLVTTVCMAEQFDLLIAETVNHRVGDLVSRG
jgi:hypothetical protein